MRHPTSRRAKPIVDLLICLFVSAMILGLCSEDSPLYPLNPWNDVNCFVTVADGWRHGLLPYRDLVEQKGPLLYLIHVLALTLTPRSYHGIFILEVLCMTCSMLLSQRILSLYIPRISAAWAAPIVALICSGIIFQKGDTAEQWCMPLMLTSLYAALSHFRTGRAMKASSFVLHGFLAGMVFWIKFNQLGLHFVFMAFLAIETLVSDRDLLLAVKRCCLFLLGMLAATLPWIVYFGLHHALSDLIYIYVRGNLFGYTILTDPLPIRTLKGLVRNLFSSRLFTIGLAISLLTIIFAPFKWIRLKEKLYLLATCAAIVILVYGGGRSYQYYAQGFAPLLCYAVLPAALLTERLAHILRSKETRRSLRQAISLFLLLPSILYPALRSPNRTERFFPYDASPQAQIAAYVIQSDDRTMLDFDTMENGLYFAADVRPVTRHFCTLNHWKPESAMEQSDAIANGYIHFIVTCNETLEEAAGKLFRETGQRFTGLDRYRFVMQAGQFTLYERITPISATAG